MKREEANGDRIRPGDAHWFIETYEREAWCEKVTRLGRQL